MKYVISRANDFWSINPPIEGSIKEKVHERNEYAEDNMSDTYLVKRWTCEVDDFMDFVNKHGQIILGFSGIIEYPYQITVYDSYVE